MKHNLRKCFISFGLLLFSSLFLPSVINVNIAQATGIEKEKSDEYKLNLKNITLVKGKAFTLKVYNLKENSKVSFKSADPETASINEDGLISANKVGTTTITVTIKDGLIPTTLTTDITVGPPAFSVKMTRSRIILGLEETDTLNVIMKPSNTTELALFSSYDEKIAYVSSGGRITAKGLGLTYIFAAIDATNYDGTPKFARCTVIVTAPENVTPLKNYFDEHTELDLIPEEDLRKALEDFFNKNTSDSSKTTSADSNAKSTSADNNTKTAAVADTSSKSIVEALDQYLNKKFNLAELRKSKEETTSNAGLK